MEKIHHKLLAKSNYYQRWHNTSHHKHVHWLSFAVAFFISANVLLGAWLGLAVEHERLTLVPATSQAQPACGNTFYVDSSVAASGTGSQGSPWKSIKDDVNNASLSPGDCVLFKRGETWRETLDVSSSGTQGNHITFGAYGTGPKPVITGSEPMINWQPEPSKGSNVFSTAPGNEVTVVELNGRVIFRGSSSSNLNDQEWVWENNRLYVRDDNGSLNVEAGQRDSVIKGFHRHYLAFDNLKLQLSNLHVVHLAPADGWRFTNVDFYGSGEPLGTGSGGWPLTANLIEIRHDPGVSNSEGLWVEDSTFDFTTDGQPIYGYWCKGPLAQCPRVPANLTVLNSRFTNIFGSSADGIQVTKGVGLRIEGNYFDMRNTDGTKGTIQIQEWDGALVKNNTLLGGNYGVSANGDNIEVTGNFISEQGIKSQETWANGLFISDDTVKDNITFANNVISHTINGIYAWRKNITNLKIYNNTIYDCQRHGFVADANISGEFKNNIIWCPNASHQIYNSGNPGTWVSDNNILGPQSSQFIRWQGTFHPNLGSFTSATGHDGNSSVGDPLFASPVPGPGVDDLHIQSSSPAINSGSNVGLTTDVENNTRPAGAGFDIGAYEFGATGGTPPPPPPSSPPSPPPSPAPSPSPAPPPPTSNCLTSETVIVPGNAESGVNSQGELCTTRRYKFTSSGTYGWKSGGQDLADAEFYTEDGWTTQARFAPNNGLDLLINSQNVEWVQPNGSPEFNPAHIYVHEQDGPGGQVLLKVDDGPGSYNDNTGQLTVLIEDIGPAQSGPPPPPSPPPPSSSGNCGDHTPDLDCDSQVDDPDLSIMLGQWEQAGLVPSDLDCDDIVNVVDFGIMMSWWGPYSGGYWNDACGDPPKPIDPPPIEGWNHDYPRTAYQHFGQSPAEYLAKFDLIIKNGQQSMTPKVRSIDPSTKWIFTRGLSWENKTGKSNSWITNNCPRWDDNFWAVESSGNFVSGGGSLQLVDMSELGLTNSQGEHYYEYIPECLAEFAENWPADGVGSDWFIDKPRVKDIDLDRNCIANGGTQSAPGCNDYNEHGTNWVNNTWKAGVEFFVANLRTEMNKRVYGPASAQLSGEESPIWLNSGLMHQNRIAGTLEHTNGLELERTSGFLDFDRAWTDYKQWIDDGRKPSAWVTDARPPQGDFDSYVGSRGRHHTKNYLEFMRMFLTFTMMGDGYMEMSPPPPLECRDGVDNDFDGQVDSPADSGCTNNGQPSGQDDDETANEKPKPRSKEHGFYTYYDEYDVRLGWPTSDAHRLGNDVMVRFFDNGAAIMNPNNFTVTVSTSDISGLAGYAGPYHFFKGGQDLALNRNSQSEIKNDGSSFSSVTLQGHSHSSGQRSVGDGVILISSPATVVSDIEIDHFVDFTSPASEPAVLSGAWTAHDKNSGNLASKTSWSQKPKSGWETHATAPGGSSSTARYTPNIGVEGPYDVYEWHADLTGGGEATNVSYTINHSGGQASQTVNQAANAGQWNLLGRFDFKAGESGNVTISAQGASGIVIADAIKFVYMGSGRQTGPPPPPSPSPAPAPSPSPSPSPAPSPAPAPPPGSGSPSISITSPAGTTSANPAQLQSGMATVNFAVQNHALGQEGQSHMHYYVDGDPVENMFYNRANCDPEGTCVARLGSHTHATHWKDPMSVDLFGLTTGTHEVRFALVDAIHQELTNPEAETTVYLNVLPPAQGEFDLTPVLTGLTNAAKFAFAPDGRFFYNEIGDPFAGSIKQTVSTMVASLGNPTSPNYPDWSLASPTPFCTFEVDAKNDGGLIGLALDPNFSSPGNEYVYIYYVPFSTQTARLSRFKDQSGTCGTEEILLDDFLAPDKSHLGGDLNFGADGQLYITVGYNNRNEQVIQDPTDCSGKILRLNKDGTLPVSGGYPRCLNNSTRTQEVAQVYSLGWRNPFDAVFHPHTGDYWASENGPTSDDEVNLILPNGNYGWPCFIGNNTPNPTHSSTPTCQSLPASAVQPASYTFGSTTIGPTGLTAVSESSSYPALYHNNLLLLDVNVGQVRRFELTGANLDQLSQPLTAFGGGAGPLLDINEALDGYMYVSSFDSIYRLELAGSQALSIAGLNVTPGSAIVDSSAVNDNQTAVKLAAGPDTFHLAASDKPRVLGAQTQVTPSSNQDVSRHFSLMLISFISATFILAILFHFALQDSPTKTKQPKKRKQTGSIATWVIAATLVMLVGIGIGTLLGLRQSSNVSHEKDIAQQPANVPAQQPGLIDWQNQPADFDAFKNN